MKHITYAEKSLLVGDELADLILQYGAHLASNGVADTVTVHAYGADGDEVIATLLLDSGSNIMAESTNSRMVEPDNAAVVAFLQERIRLFSSPPASLPSDDFDNLDFSELNEERPGM